MSTIKIEEIKLNKIAEKNNGRKYDDSVILHNVEIPVEDVVLAISKSNPELLRDIILRTALEDKKEEKEVAPVPTKTIIEDVLESGNDCKKQRTDDITTINPFIGHAPEWQKQLRQKEEMIINYNDIEIDKILKYEYIALTFMAIAPSEKIWKRYVANRRHSIDIVKDTIAEKGLTETLKYSEILADKMKEYDIEADVEVEEDIIIKGLYHIAPSRRQWIISFIGSIPNIGEMKDSEILKTGLDRYGVKRMTDLAVFINRLM